MIETCFPLVHCVVGTDWKPLDPTPVEVPVHIVYSNIILVYH